MPWNADKKEERDHMKEMNTLRRELEEVKKENEFLKKAAAFFAKEIDWRHTSLLINITMNSVQDGY